jgi:hypothetical protein
VIVATLIAVFVALMVLGVPIAFAMGVAAIILIPFAGGVPMEMLTHRLVMIAD